MSDNEKSDENHEVDHAIEELREELSEMNLILTSYKIGDRNEGGWVVESILPNGDLICYKDRRPKIFSQEEF